MTIATASMTNAEASRLCDKMNSFRGLRMLSHDGTTRGLAIRCSVRFTPRDSETLNCLIDYTGTRAFQPRTLRVRVGDRVFDIEEVLWHRSRTMPIGIWVSLQTVVREREGWEWEQGNR